MSISKQRTSRSAGVLLASVAVAGPGLAYGQSSDEAGSITVRKEVATAPSAGVVPPDVFDFSIATSGGRAADFQLTVGGADQVWDHTLPPDTYTVVEKSPLPAHWTFVEKTCQLNEATPRTAGAPSSVILPVGAGDSWDCTFKNDREPKFGVRKRDVTESFPQANVVDYLGLNPPHIADWNILVLNEAQDTELDSGLTVDGGKPFWANGATGTATYHICEATSDQWAAVGGVWRLITSPESSWTEFGPGDLTAVNFNSADWLCLELADVELNQDYQVQFFNAANGKLTTKKTVVNPSDAPADPTFDYRVWVDDAELTPSPLFQLINGAMDERFYAPNAVVREEEVLVDGWKTTGIRCDLVGETTETLCVGGVVPGDPTPIEPDGTTCSVDVDLGQAIVTFGGSDEVLCEFYNEFDDGDGVPPEVEDTTPGLGPNGNGDATADKLQKDVSTLPGHNPDCGFTVANNMGLQQYDLSVLPSTVLSLAGINVPCGGVSFHALLPQNDINGEDQRSTVGSAAITLNGNGADFDVYVYSPDVVIQAFLKQIGQFEFKHFPASSVGGNVYKTTIHIDDDGQYDLCPGEIHPESEERVICDPVFPVAFPETVGPSHPGVAKPVPTLGLWGLGALAAGLLGIAGGFARRFRGRR